MHELLASTTTTPAPDAFIAWLIAGLLLLIGFFREVSRFLGKPDRQQITNDPLEVREAHEFVRRVDFHKHAEINRAEHDKLWQAYEKHRDAHDLKITELVERTVATAATMERIGEDVREAARMARDAANTATAALIEAKHKKP